MTANLGRFRVEVAHLHGLSSTHTGHTLQQAPLLSPVRTCFHPSPATFTLRSVRLHLSTPPFHHTPWGLVSWQLDRTAITATSGYSVPCGLPGAPLTAISMTKVPISHSPLDCLAWAWPAHLLYLTVCRPQKQVLLPGSCHTPFMGKETRRSLSMCVCVRAHARVWQSNTCY